MAKMRSAKRSEKGGGAERGSSPKGTPAKRRERKPGELSTFQKAVIIVFIVIFALSTLAGALASVFQSSQTIEYNVEYIDSQYSDYVADLESKLEEDPDDAETLLATARACSTWGSYVQMLATTEEESAHGTELLQRAIGYYDRCIELEGASDARAERAMCEYYLGDVETAIADLEALTADDPDYANAWYDLGMLYEGQARTEDAVAAYERAAELDPDDESGVGANAQSRIDDLTGASGEDTEAADASGEDTDTTAEDTGASDSSEAGE